MMTPAKSEREPAVCRFIPPGAEKHEDDPAELDVMLMLLEHGINMKEVCVP